MQLGGGCGPIASGADPASFSGADWGALDVFRHFLSDQNGLSQVPTLLSKIPINGFCINVFGNPRFFGVPILDHKSIRWIQTNTLVRFRGMIQDMLGNEFYVGAYKVLLKLFWLSHLRV
ncbi:Mini-chromosome maintenance complex-binding protein [Trema orientale]|uniref:Mini-chromosome maintenance complex-binding protein n=1 Tax=Trema orientale TaxID=63057 RepID=A0A2P5F1T8_TREOI|nr:Mini-chromosome maintenance complex-binding protein [Trema orientale]